MSGFPTCAATWDVRKSKSSIDRCSSITAKCRIVLYSAFPWIQSKRVSSSKKSHCHENMKLSTLSREMCPTLLVVWRRGSKVVDAGAVVLLYMNSSTSIFVLGKRESICRCSPPPRFKSNEATGDSACCAINVGVCVCPKVRTVSTIVLSRRSFVQIDTPSSCAVSRQRVGFPIHSVPIRLGQ